MYAALFEQVPLGAILSDIRDLVVYANAAAHRLFGYDGGEMAGREVFNLYSEIAAHHAEDPAISPRLSELAFAWSGTVAGRRKDGVQFTCNAQIKPFAAGDHSYRLWLQNSAAESSKLLDQARESEARLSLATSAAGIGIWDWEIATGAMTYSPIAKAISGFSHDRNVTFADVQEIVHPDDLPFTLAQAQRAIDPSLRDDAPYEYRIARPDGQVRWVLAHGRAVFAYTATGPRAVRYVGTIQDITEQKQLQIANRESARRLRLAIDAGRMAIWEVDLRADTVKSSPELNRLLGFPEGAHPTLNEMRARNYPGERERMERLGQEVLARGERFIEGDYRYVWPDGSIRWLLLRCEVLFGPDGAPATAVGVLADVTESKRASETLRSTAEKQAFLGGLAEAVRAVSDPLAIIAKTTKFLGERIGAMRVVYADIDEAQEWACTEGDWTNGTAEHLPAKVRLEDFGSELIAALRTGESLIANDVRIHPVTAKGLAALEGIGVGAVISVPLVKEGNIRASLNVHSRDPRAWTSLDVELTEAVAERTWDVLAQARAVRALAEREYELQMLTDTLPVLVSYVDADRRYRFVNRAYEDWFSMDRGRIIGCPVAQVLGDDAYAAVAPHIDRALSGERVQFNSLLPYTHAAPRHVEVEYIPREDAAGTVEGFYALIQDVTEREANHAALQASESSLRELNADLERQVIERTQARGRSWQVGPDLMGALNIDGYFETSNPAWLSVLGWTEAELATVPIWDILHPDDLEQTREVAKRAERGEAVMRFPNRFRCKDGTYRWISWVGVPEDGLVYCTGRDITIEKEQEEALLAAQEALRQSQKLEAMGQLTGGVAHDFNNLLTPIVGSLDVLQRKGLGGEREQRLIAGALKSADRAKTLVQRLLSFARRQPLQAVPVDVAALTQGIAELIVSTTGPQVRVVVDAPEGLPPARADPNQIEMALLNLSVNARDAMPDGGTLGISLKAEAVSADNSVGLQPGAYLRLSVADTGTGMDEATRARAVEPFFSTKGVGKGTGLGLSMVHGLALQLGGALTIKSRLGAGTKIELWLPQSSEPVPVERAAVEFVGTVELGQVLLVDDDDTVRLSTADMLVELGYLVTEASSAEEAIDLLESGLLPHTVLTDHLMPGMSGSALADWIKNNMPKIKVLLISGYAELDHVAIEVPRLSKPFRREELVMKLSEL